MPDPAPPVSSAEERLVAALEASRAGTWRWDIPGNAVEWDSALSRLYGIPHERSPRTAEQFLELIHPDDRDHAKAVIGGCLEGGSEIEYEFRVVVPGGVRWIYDRSRVVRDAAGRPLYMTGACLDVTARKATEDRLRAAVADRDLLLRELGHRVANSLQLILAILGLQAREIADPAARAQLAKAVDRVGAVARLHNHLYRREQADLLRLDEFLGHQIEEFRGALTDPSRVAVAVELDAVEVDFDHGLRIGLLLNEILTNAAKYAFPDGRHGEIRVRLEQRPGAIRLSVADDGIGLDAGIGRPGTGSIIIDRLCAQLGGKLTVASTAGTTYDLDLPM